MTPGPMTPSMATGVMQSAMTVDIEDYFQVQAFSDTIARTSWDSIPRRVEANTERILTWFAEAQTQATFFTLGWVAERHPQLIRRIVAAGHELASHGYDHIRADKLSEPEFRADVGRTRRLLEDLGGVAVKGYRAPTFSIGTKNLWAFRALEAEGYAYSSSIYPVRHDLYGMPGANRFPFRPDNAALWELPMTTLVLGGQNLPWSGGGYFRLLPYPLYKRGLARILESDRRPGIFYFHPWEIDPAQPVVANVRLRARLRHRLNLAQMERRLSRLLRDFAWNRVDRVFAAELASPPVTDRGSVP